MRGCNPNPYLFGGVGIDPKPYLIFYAFSQSGAFHQARLSASGIPRQQCIPVVPEDETRDAPLDRINGASQDFQEKDVCYLILSASIQFLERE